MKISNDFEEILTDEWGITDSLASDVFSSGDSFDISGQFSSEDLSEICNEYGVTNIIEVNVIIESALRNSIMLEATSKKDLLSKVAEKEMAELDIAEDDEPVTEEVPEEPVPDEVIDAPAPSLSDLDEPDGAEEPTPEEPAQDAPIAPAVSVGTPPQPEEIPSTEKLPPEEKEEEPATSYEWKREKHLRTLYNNFFKVFPKRGSASNLDVKFTAIKADALHPDSKYLQANVTSICESEKDKGKYYNQWMQIRRQRKSQPWSADLPCEVRCNCKSFIYFMAYANTKNKSLAGQSTTKGRLDGYPINYNIPSNETNPNHIPSLCKHLMALSNQIFDMNSGLVRKSNIV